MGQGVVADGGASFGRLRAGAELSVAAIGVELFFGDHVILGWGRFSAAPAFRAMGAALRSDHSWRVWETRANLLGESGDVVGGKGDGWGGEVV